MAAAKRKADNGTENTPQKAKRNRAAKVSATAATDRPRRSERRDSTKRQVASSTTAVAGTNTNSVSVTKKEKTSKATANMGKKQNVEKGRNEAQGGKGGKKTAGKVKQERVAAAEDSNKAPESGTPKSQGTFRAPPATKEAKKNAPAESEERAPGEIRYWLMKAEPESRIEKGVDVKFSIHDLEARTEPEPWDGVRNPMAQKNMRNMKKGDLAFFYHSNCKIPGIAGLMQIAREHSIDESAFDEKHPYFDPKSSRDKPRWRVVHVEHLRTLEELVSLKELQKYAKDGGPLAGMQVLRMSRLSVSQVSAEEWEYIIRELIGINPKDIQTR